MRLEPHPYALMLPGLTDEEYAALKGDIAEHGILVPVIVDADGLVLDGVHRTRIAAELGIDPPLSQMGQMTEERKMHLAVGLNMRRRHLDADRRRELVRRLADEQGLTVRKIASITGWSKSTVDRDLKTSPFEELIGEASIRAAKIRQLSERVTQKAAREILEWGASGVEGIGEMFGWASDQWKRGNWPPPPQEHVEITSTLHAFALTLRGLSAVVEAEDEQARARAREKLERDADRFDGWRRWWEALGPDERQREAEEMLERGVLIDLKPVPDGTRHEVAPAP